MKIKSSFVLGLIVLVSLLGGLSLMSRLNEEQESWSPSSMYSSLGGSQGSSYSTVSYGSVASSDAVGQINSGASSMFRHRAVSSYAHVGANAGINTLSMGSTSGVVATGGLYTTSTAEVRTFGGGGNAVSVSGGSVKSAPAAATTAVGAISVPSLAFNSSVSASSILGADESLRLNGEIALASSAASPYAGVAATIGVGDKGITGRRNIPGITDGYYGWLTSGYWGYGSGYDQLTYDDLRNLYIAATGDTDFSNQAEWEAFLAWFNDMQDDENFGWYWAPISDAVPFMLLLCLAYALYVYFRTKKAKALEGEK